MSVCYVCFLLIVRFVEVTAIVKLLSNYSRSQ